MKKKLLLITKGFPFGEHERSFLPAEFDRLTQEFQISILTGCQEPLLYPFPEDIPVRRFKSGRVLSDPKALLWLLSAPFRPSVVREVLRAAKGCALKKAAQRGLRILKYDLSAKRAMSAIRAIIDEEKTDLVYTYWCTAFTLGTVRLKKRYPALKAITRFHGYDLYQERFPTGWQPFRDVISKECSLLIFAAERGRQYYLDAWGRQWTEKSVLAYLGCRALAPAFGGGGADGLALVSCSFMIPLKRIERIIDALALLPESVRVRWYHIGDGESRAALTERAEKSLSSRSNIRWSFLGCVPNGELDALYQTLRPGLFITTTTTEGGAPVSIQEAFSSGIPAAATAVGGIPELVRDGETGFLLPKNPTAEEVSAAIQQFYELPAAEKAAMSARARALWEEDFDAEKNAEAFVGLLKRLLEGEGGTAHDQE